MALPAMPYTAAAVQAAAELVQWAWIELAQGSSLSARQQVVYVRGLTRAESLVYPADGNPLAARVVNMARAAPSLEEGTPAYHLPERINWGASRAARRTKAGKYYMVIPFTHGAYRGKKGPSATQARAMPAAVYRRARTLQSGQFLTSGPTGGAGVHSPGMQRYVPRYHRNVRPDFTHALRQERMMRRRGRGTGGQYLTFRTMTESSSGWWIPPTAGVHLAQQVQRDTAPVVRAMLEAGVRQDLETAARETLGG